MILFLKQALKLLNLFLRQFMGMCFREAAQDQIGFPETAVICAVDKFFILALSIVIAT